MTHCASCGRQLKRDPIMVNDLPMGPQLMDWIRITEEPKACQSAYGLCE